MNHAFGSVGADSSWVPWCRWQGSSPWPSQGTSGLEPGRVVLVYHCPTGPEWPPGLPVPCRTRLNVHPWYCQTQGCRHRHSALLLPWLHHPQQQTTAETPGLPFAQSPANCDGAKSRKITAGSIAGSGIKPWVEAEWAGKWSQTC